MSYAFRLGGLAQNDSVTGLKNFTCAPSASNYDCFEIDAVNYQVTAGKTLYITKVIFYGGAGVQYVIGYGTAAVDNGAGAPAGFVIASRGYAAATANETKTVDTFIIIPASKYPHIKEQGAQALHATILGIEI